MKRYGTFIIVLLTLLSGCRQKPDAELTALEEVRTDCPLRIEKKLEIQLDNQVGVEPVPKVLAMPGQVLVFHFDASGYRATKMICDAYSHRLERKWRKEFPLGQGPGDVWGAIRFFFIDGKVYGMDYGLQRLILFDTDMNYQDTKKMPNANMYSFITDDGRYYFWVGGRNNEWPIHITSLGDSKSRKFAHFGPFPGQPLDKSRNIYFMKVFPDVILFHHGDNVYFFNCKAYSLHRMTMTGRVDRAVRLKVPEVRFSPEENEANAEVYIRKLHIRRVRYKRLFAPVVQPAAGVVRLRKGFIVLRRTNYDPACYDMLEGDYFTWDLTPGGKVRFPCFAECKGHIFSLNAQSLWANGIYLVQGGGEDDESDRLTFWEVEE